MIPAMSKYQLALTETEFFRNLIAGKNDNLPVAYKDFVVEVSNVCSNAENQMVAITALVLVEVEFHHLLSKSELHALNEELTSFIVKALDYIRRTLCHLKEVGNKPVNMNVVPAGDIDTSVNMTWNASKTDIVELAYAFKVAKCFEGDVSVKQIAEQLCLLFNTTMPDGNYTYKKFCDMRVRGGSNSKRNKRRTYFLDRISDNLNDHMDKLDREDCGD